MCACSIMHAVSALDVFVEARCDKPDAVTRYCTITDLVINAYSVRAPQADTVLQIVAVIHTMAVIEVMLVTLLQLF
jgi:hypothetical protein